MAEKKDVLNFWSSHPLGSYEVKEDLGSVEYFATLKTIRNDSSFFVMDFFYFRELKDKKVLDVGCGPGWITHQYARNSAKIYSLDLTVTAVQLAKRYLAQDNLVSRFVVADAEHIPYRAEVFDFVSCDGVLHHTPGTEHGIQEIYRVLKVGSRAVLSFYYENILLRQPFFVVTKLLLKILRIKMHGVQEISLGLTREEFGRLYDGIDNPLGKIFSKAECEQMLKKSGFQVIRSKVFFFPKRFFPFHKILPLSLCRLMDQVFGTMIFFEVMK